MKVKARLLTRSGKDEGSIQIVAYFENQQKEMALGRKVLKSVWDAERGLARGHEYQMLNVQIRNKVREVTAAIDEKIAKKEKIILHEIFNELLTPVSMVQKAEVKAELTLKKFVADFIFENPDKIQEVSLKSYRALLKSLDLFDINSVLLHNVDVVYVNQFYNFLQNEGLGVATIETKFKRLKKIMSSAIARGLATEYPFGKGKLKVPTAKTTKRKFLTEDEIQKLIQYIPKNESEVRVMRIIKFNLHVGLRISDILTLRRNNIIEELHPTKGNILRLSKTTVKTDTDINILLTNQAKQQIIDGGYENLGDTELLFPWLVESDFQNEYKLYNAISAKTAYFNKILANICKSIEIKHISSHSLRHTFCTTLISKGVPITSISKMVGHSDVSTTMIYAQIVQNTVDDAISVLDE